MTYIYNSPLNFNIPKVAFKATPNTYAPQIKHQGDGFVTNPLYQNLGNITEIEASAKSNPRIREIMNEYNIPMHGNKEEFDNLQKGHLKDTRVLVAKMYSSLPIELKNEVNLPNLQEAAMLHDYGKVLIPNSILNKQGELTPKEREIMQQHSELGYELLKNKDLNPEVLNLIKYHHQTPTGSGYPALDNDYTYNTSAQLLSVADKYTALTEERCYKKALSREEALNIIKQDVDSGLVDETIYNALVKVS